MKKIGILLFSIFMLVGCSNPAFEKSVKTTKVDVTQQEETEDVEDVKEEKDEVRVEHMSNIEIDESEVVE